jgi:membrane protein
MTHRAQDGDRPVVSAMARIKAARVSALRKAQQAPRPVLRVATTFLRELTNIEPFDRAMTLAAQAFTSIFPLLITLAAFFDHGNGSVGDDIATTLSLPDSVRRALDQALPADTEQLAAFGIISVLIVLVSATSLSRALGRMYAKAWHVPPAGWNGGWRWLVVIVALCTATIATQLLNHSERAFAENVAALSLTCLLNTMLWAWVPWLLLVGRVSVIRLLPAATLMGVGSVGLTVASQIYMPHALTIGEEHFGSLGVAFTFIGWLFVVSFVLVIATVLGAVIAQDEGVEGLVLGLRRRLPARLRKPSARNSAARSST